MMPFNLTFGRLPNSGDVVAAVYSVNNKTGVVVLNAADVGAATEQYVDEKLADIPIAPVLSVNEKTGDVTLDANDVGAEPFGSIANLKAYVDEQDALKANSDYVDQQDQLLQEQIDLKANAQAVNQALSTKADLDESGKVPASQLPSYVDDVLDGRYVNPSQFNNLDGIPYTPESGKVYVDVDTNKTYRWSGMLYVVIGGGGVALGETSETAYRGDRGKAAYDHSQSQGNPHNSTTSDIPEGLRLYFTPLRVRATDLTGYTLGANSPITVSDTVLSAFGKLQGQSNTKLSASTWVDASTLGVYGSKVDLSGTKIELSKFNGMIFARGYFKCGSSSMNTGELILSITHADWQLQIPVEGSTNSASAIISSALGSAVCGLVVRYINNPRRVDITPTITVPLNNTVVFSSTCIGISAS